MLELETAVYDDRQASLGVDHAKWTAESQPLVEDAPWLEHLPVAALDIAQKALQEEWGSGVITIKDGKPSAWFSGLGHFKL